MMGVTRRTLAIGLLLSAIARADEVPGLRCNRSYIVELEEQCLQAHRLLPKQAVSDASQTTLTNRTKYLPPDEMS